MKTNKLRAKVRSIFTHTLDMRISTIETNLKKATTCCVTMLISECIQVFDSSFLYFNIFVVRHNLNIKKIRNQFNSSSFYDYLMRISNCYAQN